MRLDSSRSHAGAAAISTGSHGDVSASETPSAIGVGVVCTAVLVARLPSGLSDTLWAEDGSRFLSQALNDPALPTLIEPYAGYLHVLPRLLSLLVAQMPVLLMARANNYLACAAVGVTAMVVFACARSVMTARLPRAWLALGPALLPVVAQEAVGSLANLHWFLLWGCFWVLWHRGERWWTVAAATAFMTLATLSEIQCALLVPVAVIASVVQRKKPLWTLLPTLAWAACSVWQLAVTMSHPRPGEHHIPSLTVLTRLFSGDVLLTLLSNDPSTLQYWLEHGAWKLPLILGALFAGLLLYSLLRGDWAVRGAGVTAVTSAVALYALAITVNELPNELTPLPETTPADLLLRYAIAPQLLLLTAIALGWSVALRRGSRLMMLLVAVSVLTTALVGAMNLQAPSNRRSPLTLWPAQVSIAEKKCNLAPIERSRIPISPGFTWGVEMPCQRLRELAGT